MTNILDRANKLLETVEPTRWMDQHGLMWDESADDRQAIYSRETVERLFAEHRKQVLLEAAQVVRHEPDGFCASEKLSRMAEGEKHE